MDENQRTLALRELYRRKLASESLLAYAKSVEIPGAPVGEDELPDDWIFDPIESGIVAHHRLMMEAIQRCMSRPYGRLMLFLPPGAAKSTYASVVAPTWYMGRHPGSRIVLASYASNIARKHSKRARQLVRSDDYQAIFDTTLARDSKAADEWALDNGSEYMSGGIMSGITGNRASGWIIDDPVANREDADSETIRAKTLSEFEDSIKTRALPNCWGIIVQTRWHESDLAGSILPENYDGRSGIVRCRDGADWEVICVPALAERADDPLGRAPGDPFWPEWFPLEHWEQYKSNGRTWNSLFQQRPTADEGTFFKREWFADRRPAPHNPVNVYMACDAAISEGKGDWTEIGIFGVDTSGVTYVLDWWYGQTTADVWVEALLDKVAVWKPLALVFEKSNIEQTVLPFLRLRMRERGVFAAVELIPTMGDKSAKAQSFQGRQASGMVKWPSTPWAERVIDQMLRFPAGRHDDAVDTASAFGRYLADVWQAAAKRPPPVDLEDAWDNVPSMANLMPKHLRRIAAKATTERQIAERYR